MFYLITPVLYKLDNRKLFSAIIIAIILGFTLSHFHIQDSLSISYRRLPAFIYGIILYRIYKEGELDKISKNTLYVTIAIECIGIYYVFLG